MLELLLAWAAFKLLTARQGDAEPESGTSSIPKGTAVSYIEKFHPLAEQMEKFYLVPAKFTLAQGGLESHWGTSDLAVNAFNHFGIKADKNWNGPAYKGYRRYRSADESFADHAKFLTTNKRYDAAFNTRDPFLFAQAVAAADYATDPDYLKKITSVIQLIS